MIAQDHALHRAARGSLFQFIGPDKRNIVLRPHGLSGRRITHAFFTGFSADLVDPRKDPVPVGLLKSSFHQDRHCFDRSPGLFVCLRLRDRPPALCIVLCRCSPYTAAPKDEAEQHQKDGCTSPHTPVTGKSLPGQQIGSLIQFANILPVHTVFPAVKPAYINRTGDAQITRSPLFNI